MSPLSSPHKGIVLLADDDESFRETVQDALEDAGYLVLPARSGQEALARMRGLSAVMLAIVDLNMPGMDGWELISAMRADKQLTATPIFVVSSHGREPISGASRLFRKPVDLKALLGAIEQLIGEPPPPAGSLSRRS